MNSLKINYDAWRGGFYIGCGPRYCAPDQNSIIKVKLFDGLLDAIWSQPDSRLMAVTSDWGYGGLPLQSLHQPIPNRAAWLPEGNFSFQSNCIQARGYVTVTQSRHAIEFLFGNWRRSLPTFYDAEKGVQVWLSDKTVPRLRHPELHPESPMVAGITLGFQTLAACYPLESIDFSLEDFK